MSVPTSTLRFRNCCNWVDFGLQAVPGSTLRQKPHRHDLFPCTSAHCNSCTWQTLKPSECATAATNCMYLSSANAAQIVMLTDYAAWHVTVMRIFARWGGLGADLGVGHHDNRLKLRNGLGNIGILLLGRLGVLSPQHAAVRPPHPCICMRLKLTCKCFLYLDVYLTGDM